VDAANAAYAALMAANSGVAALVAVSTSDSLDALTTALADADKLGLQVKSSGQHSASARQNNTHTSTRCESVRGVHGARSHAHTSALLPFFSNLKIVPTSLAAFLQGEMAYANAVARKARLEEELQLVKDLEAAMAAQDLPALSRCVASCMRLGIAAKYGLKKNRMTKCDTKKTNRTRAHTHARKSLVGELGSSLACSLLPAHEKIGSRKAPAPRFCRCCFTPLALALVPTQVPRRDGPR